MYVCMHARARVSVCVYVGSSLSLSSGLDIKKQCLSLPPSLYLFFDFQLRAMNSLILITRAAKHKRYGYMNVASSDCEYEHFV